LSHHTARVDVGLKSVKRNGGLDVGERLAAQDSNMQMLAFSIVILNIKEWQDIWLTRLAVGKRVKNVVKN